MKKTTAIGIAAAAVLCVTAARAVQDGGVQEAAFNIPPEVMKLMAPGPQHDKLGDLVGDYDMTLKWRMSATDPWMENDYKVRRDMVMDGRHLRETVDGDWMGQPFHGVSIIGYDNVRQEYHNIWYDNFSTGVSVSAGKADAKGDITFEGAFSDPMTGDKNRWGRSVLSADGSKFDMFAKDANGDVFKTMTIDYVKR